MQGSRPQFAGRSCKVLGNSLLEGRARFKAVVRWKVTQGSRQQFAATVRRWSCSVGAGGGGSSFARFVVDSSVGCKFFTDSGMPQPCTSKDASYFVPP